MRQPRVPAAGDAVPGLDADAVRLHELGYEQELKRGLGALENVAMGFAAISPVVALYGVVLVGMVLAGPAWVWVLPVALAGQCLVLVVYSELASEFPVANATYQWSRRLVGPTYGWLNGWVGLCAYAVANTTIAYLGAPWALRVLGIDPEANAIVATGAALVAICAIVNVLGIDVLKLSVKVGIAAEVVASVGVGLVLLLAFRHQDVSVLRETFGAEALSGGSTRAALLAALAVGGWVFIGFDACGLSSEETHDAARHVPRAVWIAMLAVGAIVILNAFALTLAHPGVAQVIDGRDVDPVSTSVYVKGGSARGLDVRTCFLPGHRVRHGSGARRSGWISAASLAGRLCHPGPVRLQRSHRAREPALLRSGAGRWPGKGGRGPDHRRPRARP
jgi:amino acid transporter